MEELRLDGCVDRGWWSAEMDLDGCDELRD